MKVRQLIAKDFLNVWASGIEVLLTPVTLTDAPKYSDFIHLDNREQCSIQDYCTQPANLAGMLHPTNNIHLSYFNFDINICHKCFPKFCYPLQTQVLHNLASCFMKNH